MSQPTRASCPCMLPLHAEPPGKQAWRPDLGAREPDGVQAVVRIGDDPAFRHAARVKDGWEERGAAVRCGTPSVMPWAHVGRCWAHNYHPVIAVIVKPGQ